jgi:hypothetical protein
VPRIDKLNPEAGGFRAPLNADYTAPTVSGRKVGVVLGVSINGSGRVVVGGALGAIRGVICLARDFKAGDVVDVITRGEIVEFGIGANGQTAAAAGTAYYANVADGVMTATTTSNHFVGFAVEATRLVVNTSIAGAP